MANLSVYAGQIFNIQQVKFEEKADEFPFLPLFLSILRSSSRHQSEQVSDGVGQESPGVGLGEREGGVSVNPPYSLL